MLSKIRASLSQRFDSRLFTYVELRDMFFPLLLDQLFIFSIGMLSSAMVSSSGEGAMTAMNCAGVVGNLTYALFSAICVGGGIVIARAKGANNPERIRIAIAQSCVMCTLIGAFLGILLSFFGRGICGLLYPSQDEKILEMCGEYLRWFGLSIIPYSLFNVIFTAFRSLGDTKSSLYLTLLINSIHLICSLLYINVYKMGVAGSALSFLTARIIGMLFAVYWLMRRRCSIHMKWSDFLVFDKDTLKDISLLGIPLSVEQLLFSGGMLLVQTYIAKLPVAQTDAHGVASSVINIYQVFSFSLMNITATICGQCIGAKDLKLTRKYCSSFVFVGRFIMLLAIIVLLPCTPLILKLYSPSAESIPYIYKCICICVIPMPVIWCDAYLISSTTRAAGDSLFTTVISVLALAFGRMLVGYVLTIELGLGVPGIWVGQCAEWVLRAVVFRLRMRGTGWIHVDMSEPKEA